MEKEPSRTSGHEIRFPVDWEFRIIVDADLAAAAKPLLAACFEKHEIATTLHEGLDSKNGRYRSFKAPLVLTDREMMNQLAAELASVPGVKFVL